MQVYRSKSTCSGCFAENIEGLTGDRVLLVDVTTEATYSGISDYCSPSNGPDAREYNALVKQNMQNAVHLAQYFPDPLLGVFNYTVEDSAGTYCNYNSDWDGCYVNGVIDRTSITLNYGQCSKDFIGSTTGLLYNVANVTLSGSTYYVILINSGGTDTIFTQFQDGNNRQFSTNPGGCAKDQVSTARTSHADSTKGTMIATVFTTTTSTTTELPTTTVNSTTAITNLSESSSSGSNTGAIVGAVLSILLTEKVKGRYQESSMVVDNLSPRDKMKEAFLEDTEPLPQNLLHRLARRGIGLHRL
ncbi:unnamed protein product [Mytilus edulis]|uniref:Uncharacterized protein n=1 Tax=Mytilus edulis TaxID=6550 RepID=A0A8S3TJ22_MYTED|nr:unnamed protein product [Mytilus edulis]